MRFKVGDKVRVYGRRGTVIEMQMEHLVTRHIYLVDTTHRELPWWYAHHEFRLLSALELLAEEAEC